MPANPDTHVPPSGIVLEAHLAESYDLTDGTRRLGPQSRQDLIGYRVMRHESCVMGEAALCARLRVVPSADIALSQLAHGEVAIDLFAPTEMEPGYVDQQGGTVTGPGGLQFEVPAGAATGPAGVTLRPGVVPANAATHPDFLGAVDLEVTGGTLDPTAAYRFHLGSPVAEGTRFLVAQQRLEQGQVVLVAIGFGQGDAQGFIVFDPCWNGACLSGVPSPDTRHPSLLLAFFGLPADAALVTGVVRFGAAVQPDIVVDASSLPVVSVTGGDGIERCINNATVRAKKKAAPRERCSRAARAATPAALRART
jgi:hypothetical protein